MRIKILYIDGTTEIREVIQRSIPETTLKAAKETGKQVIDIAYMRD